MAAAAFFAVAARAPDPAPSTASAMTTPVAGKVVMREEDVVRGRGREVIFQIKSDTRREMWTGRKKRQK